jgi:hypothetical protein
MYHFKDQTNTDVTLLKTGGIFTHRNHSICKARYLTVDNFCFRWLEIQTYTKRWLWMCKVTMFHSYIEDF